MLPEIRSQLFRTVVKMWVTRRLPAGIWKIRDFAWRQCSNQSQPWREPQGHDTGIRVFNCVARQKVPLIVRNRQLATFYTCGPTVYDDSHLGHASCYVKLDVVQRILRDYFGLPLFTAMNITDIDDKIIRRALETGRPWQELSREYETKFWLSLRSLGVQLPDSTVRVTDHMPQIQAMVRTLLEKGHAYQANDSSIYFDCSMLQSHGKLAGNLGAVDDDALDTPGLTKRSRRDFVLWKAVTSGPVFDADFGSGRPGWHIECSAMASELFGDSLDFHGGGWDLRFPHHENEESQSCAFHGTSQWVNYWLHTGQLRLPGDAQKMSKSLMNTISISDFLARHSATDFRMFCLLSNYRSNTEYSEEAIAAASSVHSKIWGFVNDMDLFLNGQITLRIDSNDRFLAQLKDSMAAFDAALRDDFDTARGIKVLMEIIGTVNRHQHAPADGIKLDKGVASCTKRFFKKQLKMFGLEVDRANFESAPAIDSVIESVVNIRSEIRRRAKDSKDKSLFFFADQIRSHLERAGIEIKDRPKQTTTWKSK